MAHNHWWNGLSLNDKKTFITNAYCVEKKSTVEVGKQLSMSHAGTRYWMRKLGINRRTISEARRGNGCVNSEGYVVMKFNQKAKKMHRVVWEQHNGTIPAGHHIHHVDGNKTNNDISNLELISASKHSSLHNARRKHG